mmetsp:Transcript_21574/g.51503  ORF Transcript_21574/g.51503 Transcript_21574/m.51503 type:complete len:94 (+) Transcript_21574:108-389(+)
MQGTLRRLSSLVSAASASALRQSTIAPLSESLAFQRASGAADFVGASANRGFRSAGVFNSVSIAGDGGHLTGIEKEELEYEAEKGASPFAEEW